MKLMFHILGLILFGGFILFSPVSHAEEGDNIKEVIAEAVYQMRDTDTPTKAEEQVLLRAKRNALEQVSSQEFTMDKIAVLPDDAFAVTILDKRKSLNGNSLEYWVQIKAVVNLDKLETALKNAVALEFYEEQIMYMNGSKTSEAKMWFRSDGMRSEVLGAGLITISKNNKDNNSATVWAVRNNKYYEYPPVDPSKVLDPDLKVEIKEDDLGNEVLGSIITKKKKTTTTFSKGPISKSVTISWIDPVTNLTLKDQSTSSYDNNVFVTEYKNIKIGPQDPSLFEIPKNYIRCATMDELFVDGNNTYSAQQNQVDPFQKVVDSALDAAAKQAIDRSLNGILGF